MGIILKADWSDRLLALPPQCMHGDFEILVKTFRKKFRGFRFGKGTFGNAFGKETKLYPQETAREARWTPP